MRDIALTYVEGWHVIAEANRIFGYDAGDSETIATHYVWTGMANRQHSAAYTAKVRIAVRAGEPSCARAAAVAKPDYTKRRVTSP